MAQYIRFPTRVSFGMVVSLCPAEAQGRWELLRLFLNSAPAHAEPGGVFGGFPVVMPRPYIVYFKYKIPTDKTQGAVKQFRVYATTIEEARRLIGRYANYPHIEVLNVKAA